jgi:hypothetical protein
MFTLSHNTATSIDIHQFSKKYEETHIDNGYNPYRVGQIQTYNPMYSVLLAAAADDGRIDYNSIALNHKYHLHDVDTVIDQETDELIKTPVFIKFSPLLDPIRYMIGKYQRVSDRIFLPTHDAPEQPIDKIIDPNNAAYIDSFFCFLSSQLLHIHGFIHGIDFYGSFLGVQSKYRMEITDDIEYLNNPTFFNENINKKFSLEKGGYEQIVNYGSRNHKIKLEIGEETDITEIEQFEIGDLNNTVAPSEEIAEIYRNDEIANACNDSSSDSEDSDSSSEEETDTHTDDPDEDNWETDCSENTSSQSTETEQYILIDNMPVQMICLEKCDDTLDSLFENDTIDCDTAIAALFQIIMILITYRKAFDLTHNDLHTNNIVFSATTIEFLYYQFDNQTYKVPTFGKIYKIIDFGRGIYKYRGRVFCSDSFALDGDAATQYNTEPYYDDKKPRIEPNFSFDLARLGCSIYDFILDEDPPKKLDDLQKIVVQWVTDDKGKNILYKKNGRERYEGFKLYKMIAKTMHNQEPVSQLELPEFKRFLLPDKNIGLRVMNIDEIPRYV